MEKGKHFIIGNPSVYRAEGSTWDTYKCPRCGAMFEKTNDNSDVCPVCDHTCSLKTCEVLESSREEY